MKKITLSIMAICSIGQLAMAFCGFYVAKAGAELYNHKSEVILVRDGEHTSITMSNDFKGNVKDFAMVVPVPNVISRKDIQIADRSIFSKLDDYSSPRLVEYYDDNPCRIELEGNYIDAIVSEMQTKVTSSKAMTALAKKHQVKIEARYSVEEYDILILSAKKSSGLKNWLLENDYKIPAKAEKVLEPYIKSGLKFFVVKVDLEKYNPEANNGFLRPLQIKVKTDKFMLPIRLGMANSVNSQDMIVYAFSKKGRVECTNYRTVKMPTGNKIPTFIKPKFGLFYKDVFDNKHKKEGKDVVFLEYAWNVTPSWRGMKCDPCVGDPPRQKEFIMAGVPWYEDSGIPTYFTRLHVRYSIDEFPEDLFFIETPNKQNYQARYVITHPAKGDLSCEMGIKYKKFLKKRRMEELSSLALLADWDIRDYSEYVDSGKGKKVQKRNTKDNTVIPFSPQNNDGGGSQFQPLLVVIFSLLFVYVLNGMVFRFKHQEHS